MSSSSSASTSRGRGRGRGRRHHHQSSGVSDSIGRSNHNRSGSRGRDSLSNMGDEEKDVGERPTLGEQYTDHNKVRSQPRTKRAKADARRREYLDAATSQKIIDQAREQIEEEDDNYDGFDGGQDTSQDFSTTMDSMHASRKQRLLHLNKLTQHPAPHVKLANVKDAFDSDDDDDGESNHGKSGNINNDHNRGKRKSQEARRINLSASRKAPSIYLRERFNEEGTHRHSDAESDGIDDEVAGTDFDGTSLSHQLELDPTDLSALDAFLPEETPQRMTLADVILSKIQENKTEIQTHLSEIDHTPVLPPQIVRLYKNWYPMYPSSLPIKSLPLHTHSLCKAPYPTSKFSHIALIRVGEFMSRYKSGKVLKAIKRMPIQPNWEELMYLTSPDTWSAAMMYQVTRLFSSNLNAKKVQRFYNLVLLPRVRDDISEFKKLNYHLYHALLRALFKPRAFYLGIILPLCLSGDCTLREAVIIGSVLARKSIPAAESCAAMIKIAETPYAGANSIFLRVLIDKKYALPYRVIDALVAHFVRTQHDKRELPTLWHQCLLVFVQRYRKYISDEQKHALQATIKVHRHHKITPVILYALQHEDTTPVSQSYTN